MKAWQVFLLTMALVTALLLTGCNQPQPPAEEPAVEQPPAEPTEPMEPGTNGNEPNEPVIEPSEPAVNPPAEPGTEPQPEPVPPTEPVEPNPDPTPEPKPPSFEPGTPGAGVDVCWPLYELQQAYEDRFEEVRQTKAKNCYNAKYLKRVTSPQDAAICNEVKDTFFRVGCYASIAALQGNEAFCDNLAEESFTYRAYHGSLSTRNVCRGEYLKSRGFNRQNPAEEEKWYRFCYTNLKNNDYKNELVGNNDCPKKSF